MIKQKLKELITILQSKENMERLYAPWRAGYAAGDDESKQPDAGKEQCAFCKIHAEKNDAENFILKRYSHSFAVLNKYPYNAGHLLIIPNAHENSMQSLPVECLHQMIELVAKISEQLHKKLKTEGLNVGWNIGRASGAGIPSHVHIHILPRWIGDTNFLPTLADTKVVSFDLNEIYQDLLPLF